MDTALLGTATAFAHSAENLGEVGLMLIFCLYLAWANYRDKKHCGEMVEKVMEYQGKLDTVLRDIEKQLELSNKIYTEVRAADTEFRRDISIRLNKALNVGAKKPTCEIGRETEGRRVEENADFRL